MTVSTATDIPANTPTDVGSGRPIYLDCNATTPLEPRVADEVMKWTAEEFGNAGSRTHSYGQVAKSRVNLAREEVAAVVSARADEVVFTSGATESNNIAILGLAAYGLESGRRHLVTTQIEHKAVLEPMRELQSRGFELTEVPPEPGGWVDPARIKAAIRPDTLIVSMMAVNNETGVMQPISEIADCLDDSQAYLHVDAAQGFGKTLDLLRHPRIDLMSVSGHKIYGPKGVGALVARRRRFQRPPLRPVMFGGGQERGLRPGTLPVALIAGLGTASRIAVDEAELRAARCQAIRESALSQLTEIGAVMNGALERTVAHTLNFSVPGVDSEAAIVALKDVAAISNGSACTSQSYSPSHVLVAAGLPDYQVQGALRISWCHLTGEVDWVSIAAKLSALSSG